MRSLFPIRGRHSTRVLLLGLFALLILSGCGMRAPLELAPSIADSPAEASGSSIRVVEASPDWSSLDDLAKLELSFYDEERQEMIHVTGPYRIVRWDEERVELVGQRDSTLEETDRLTLWENGDQLWAHLALIGAEYLTRVR